MKDETLKKMKSEIVTIGARAVGYSYAILDTFDYDDIVSTEQELASVGLKFSKAPRWWIDDLIVTELVKSMTLEEFREKARYFFSYASYERAENKTVLKVL